MHFSNFSLPFTCKCGGSEFDVSLFVVKLELSCCRRPWSLRRSGRENPCARRRGETRRPWRPEGQDLPACGRLCESPRLRRVANPPRRCDPAFDRRGPGAILGTQQTADVIAAKWWLGSWAHRLLRPDFGCRMSKAENRRYWCDRYADSMSPQRCKPLSVCR